MISSRIGFDTFGPTTVVGFVTDAGIEVCTGTVVRTADVVYTRAVVYIGDVVHARRVDYTGAVVHAADAVYTGAVVYTALRRSDGKAAVCGFNSVGQCDVLALEDGRTYTHVAAGDCHTALLRSPTKALQRIYSPAFFKDQG